MYLNGQPLAQIEAANSEARYTLNNRATGLKLRPQDHDYDSPIIATGDSADVPWVQFTRVPAGDDALYLRNVQTGQYFRPAGSGDGVGLVQRPTSQDDAPTQWRLEAASGEYWFLVNRWTGKHIRPNTQADGGPVVQRPHSWRGRWTQWLLVPIAPAQAQVFYYHTDHLGTPHKLTDQHGSIVWEAHYTPFGEATVNEDPDGDGNHITQNIRFPGQYFDQETGLHYNWHRYYDPGNGRYITSDPIGLKGGVNTYGYALQNPLNYFDPDGNAAQAAGALCFIPGVGWVSCAAAATVATGGSLICTLTGVCEQVARAILQCFSDDDKDDQEEQCDKQYNEVDIPTCRGIARSRGNEAAARCYASAAERYAACLAGRPMPPLDTYNN